MVRHGRLTEQKKPTSYDEGVKELDPQAQQALMRSTNKTQLPNASAFIVLAVNGDGQVAVCTSKRLLGCVNSYISPSVQRSLRKEGSAQDAGSTLNALANSDIVYPGRDTHGRVTEVVDNSESSTIEDTDLTLQDCAADTDDELPLPPISTKVMSRLLIGDTEAVCNFLRDRLNRLQQFAVKKLAKAWIKGICPKKQADFPYTNEQKRKRDGADSAPAAWWPSLDKCPFIEPDHVKKGPRVELCIHLLRLRPTPEQLKLWNKGTAEPHPTHSFVGWTAFLEELLSPKDLDQVSELRNDSDKLRQRQSYLRDLYEVARMEEEFVAHRGCDANQVFQWLDEEEHHAKSTSKKRPRLPSIASDTEKDSRASSIAACSKRAKSNATVRPTTRRTRTGRKPEVMPTDSAMEVDTNDAVATQPATEDQQRWPHHAADITSGIRRRLATSDQQLRARHFYDAQQYEKDFVSHGLPLSAGWSNDISLNTSFTSSDQSMETQPTDPRQYQAQAPQSSFPGQSNYAWPPPSTRGQEAAGRQSYQVQQVNHVPQPQFVATPTCSPLSMMNPQWFEEHFAPPPHIQPVNHLVPMSQMNNQYPISAGADIIDTRSEPGQQTTFTGFSAPYYSNGLPQRDAYGFQTGEQSE